MNTKYNTTVDMATPVREPEITLQMANLTEKIKILNHLATDALPHKLLPVTRAVEKGTDGNLAEPHPKCSTPLGCQLQDLTTEVNNISEFLSDLIQNIEV